MDSHPQDLINSISIIYGYIYLKSIAHVVVYFSATYLENGGVTVLKKTLIFLDFGFYIFNCVTSFNHKRDGFPSESS